MTLPSSGCFHILPTPITAFIVSVLSKTSVLINKHAFSRRLHLVNITHSMILTSGHVIVPFQSRSAFPIDTHNDKSTRMHSTIYLLNLASSSKVEWFLLFIQHLQHFSQCSTIILTCVTLLNDCSLTNVLTNW